MNSGQVLYRNVWKGHMEDTSDVVRLVADDMEALGVQAGDLVQVNSEGGKSARFRCAAYVQRTHGHQPVKGGVFMIEKARARLGVGLGAPVWVTAAQ